tara:strand:- start:345 stop:509 length:165 start_codon:yes stop_codon:yes gene_type:complete
LRVLTLYRPIKQKKKKKEKKKKKKKKREQDVLARHLLLLPRNLSSVNFIFKVAI